MKKGLVRKGLVISVILIFIGVGIQPAFAVTPKSSDNKNFNILSVKTSIQINKPNEVNTYHLSLTKKQSEELDAFIDDFKVKLDEAKTLEETITIYNDAIITLDKIGVIPKGATVEELQHLITGNIRLDLLKNINNIPLDEDSIENSYCLVSGSSTETSPWIFSWMGWISAIIMIFLQIPIFFGPVYFGNYGWGKTYGPNCPAVGWIHTLGLQGNKTYEGSFYGHINTHLVYPTVVCIGARGFKGIFFSNNFYIGFARQIEIGKERPKYE